MNKGTFKDSYQLPDPENHTIVSIDPGIKYTGISFSRNGTHNSTHLLVNESPIKATIALTAFDLIKSAIEEAISVFDDEVPPVIVIEDYAYGGGFFKAEQAEIIGQLKRYCVENGLIFVPIPVGTAKKAVTGNGRATKSDVKKALKSAGYEFKTSHEADSLAIYFTYLQLWREAPESIYSRSINLWNEKK